MQIALQEAQATELAAREDLAKFDIVLPADALDAPGQQLVMVQVPAGLSGGQSFQVKTSVVQIPPGFAAGQYFLMLWPPPKPAQPVKAQRVAAQPVAPVPPAGLQMERQPAE